MTPPNAAGRLVALAILACAPAAARDATVGPLTIRHPWIRATPGGAKVAGGYLTILNAGASIDRLTGGSMDASATFELHTMTTEGGVMRMRPTGPLDIPPGGSLTLSPAGRHIMFTGLKHGLKKGEAVDGTLTFERAGTVPVRFDVEGLGAKGPDGGDAPGRAMPGMDMD